MVGGSWAFPLRVSQRLYPSSAPSHPHTAVMVQVCVSFEGNLNQMRWRLSACGPVTSSISTTWMDGGMKRWIDGWRRRKGESREKTKDWGKSIHLKIKKVPFHPHRLADLAN